MGGWGVQIPLPHSLDKRTERLHLVGGCRFLSYSIYEIFERLTYVPWPDQFCCLIFHYRVLNMQLDSVLTMVR